MKKTFIRTLALVLLMCTMLAAIAIPVAAANDSYGTKKRIVSFNYDGSISQRYATFTLKGALWNKSVKINAGWLPKVNGKITKDAQAINNGARFDVKVHTKDGKLVKEYRNLKIGNTFNLPGGLKTYTVYICSKFPSYNYNNNNDRCGALQGTYKLN